MAVVMMATPMVPVDRRRLADVIALIDAEYAFDAADHAADRGSDHRADRAGDAVALIEAMSGATGDALRLDGERHSERRDNGAGD
jgi:hypothetical protein